MKEDTGSHVTNSPTRPEPPSFGLKPAAAPAPTRPTLVLALAGSSAPTESLRSARSLADELGAALHVIRVLPETKAEPAVLSSRNLPDVLRAVERTLTAHRTTRAWMREALPNGTAVDRFAILHGDFVERVAAYAGEVDAQRILVTSAEDDTKSLVTRLAAATGAPVVAARSPASARPLAAASALCELVRLTEPPRAARSRSARCGEAAVARVLAAASGRSEGAAAAPSLSE